MRKLEFFSCSRCGLRFQAVGEDEDGSIYTEIEIAREGAQGADGPLLRIDGDALAELKRATPGRRLLDVGSGDGRFLRAAAEVGFECVGVDIAPELADLARQHSGVPVLVGLLPQLQFPPASFDVVNFDLVLMYVPDPVALLRETARLLTLGGVCRIREYCSDSWTARLRGSRWWFYDETSLRVYCRRSLQYLAQQAGLSVDCCYAGTEVSRATWDGYALRKGIRGRLLRNLHYYLKCSSLGSLPFAADCAYYLRKPEVDRGSRV